MQRRTLTRWAMFTLGWVTLASCGGTVVTDATMPVNRSEHVWVDSSRVTPPTSAYPGAPTRTLRVLIWQGGGVRRLPLLILAHGFGGLPEKFDAFASTVAAAGFVVAAPAFPLTNEMAPGGHDAGFNDFVNQPADLSFVLTQLLQANHTAGNPLEDAIDDHAVAALGHSLGGVTVIASTRKNCCRDARIAASILVAAVPLAAAFGPDSIAAGPPTLIIQGTADTSVPYSAATTLYQQIQPPRILLGLKGAGHSEALESQVEPPIPARDAAQRGTIAFVNAVFRGAHGELQATLAALATAGNIVQAEENTDEAAPASGLE